jgi:hypothetical protein
MASVLSRDKEDREEERKDWLGGDLIRQKGARRGHGLINTD